MRWRTRTPPLPFAANSGQNLATGSSRLSRPSSARIKTQRNICVFVVDHTLITVSSFHGWVRSRSICPAQISTTISPLCITATLAPTSKSLSKLRAKASRTASKPLFTEPCTAIILSLLVCELQRIDRDRSREAIHRNIGPIGDAPRCVGDRCHARDAKFTTDDAGVRTHRTKIDHDSTRGQEQRRP